MIRCFLNLYRFILSVPFLTQPLILLLYSGIPHVLYGMSETAVLEKHKLTHYIEHSPCIKSERITHIPIMGDTAWWFKSSETWCSADSSWSFKGLYYRHPQRSSTPVTLCGLHDPEYEGTMILWNVCNCVRQQHSTTSTDFDCCSTLTLDYFSPLECNTMVSGSQHVQGM